MNLNYTIHLNCGVKNFYFLISFLQFFLKNVSRRHFDENYELFLTLQESSSPSVHSANGQPETPILPTLVIF